MYAKECMFLTNKGLQNSGLCSAHMTFEQEGLYCACAAVTWDLDLCGLTRDTAPLVALYDKHRALVIYSDPDPQGGCEYEVNQTAFAMKT